MKERYMYVCSGLHDYTCTLELRNHRSTIWNQQFLKLHVKDGKYRICKSLIKLDELMTYKTCTQNQTIFDLYSHVQLINSASV